MANRRTTRTSAPSSGTGRGRNRGGSASGAAPFSEPGTGPSGGRYRRTGWAFLILALAAVLALREWFGISGAAGDLLHHIAAGPVGVLGVFVPPLLAALGVAMLRVHSLGAVHARVSVGCLGLLTALTGMIQVGSGNPVLKGNIGGLESAGGLLGWLVGYPLAALFSSVGAFILFILLTVFSALVMSGKTVAEIRELLEQYRTADSDEASHGAGGSGDSLARRLLGRARRGSGRPTPRRAIRIRLRSWTPTTVTSHSAPPWRWRSRPPVSEAVAGVSARLTGRPSRRRSPTSSSRRRSRRPLGERRLRHPGRG